MTLSRLEDIRLLTVNRDASGVLVSLDAHPLLREYFGRQLRTQQPDAWRAAHRRLYEHLCATTRKATRPRSKNSNRSTKPWLTAAMRGCIRGAYGATIARILRGAREAYSTLKLGAFGSDLGAVACFFEHSVDSHHVRSGEVRPGLAVE